MTAFENMIGESEIYHIGKYLQQCSHPFPFVKTVWESESDDKIESKATNLGQDGLADVEAEILGVVRPGAGVEVEHQVVLASSPGGQALQPWHYNDGYDWILATKRCIHNIVVANLAGILRTKSCDSGSLSSVSRARMKRHAREGSEVWYLRFKRYYHGDHHVDGWNGHFN